MTWKKYAVPYETYKAATQSLSPSVMDLTTQFNSFYLANDRFGVGMMKNRRLARAMADAGLGHLLTLFTQKMKVVGGTTIVVDRFFSSTKRCSGCGHVRKCIPLKYRTYICMVCGLVIDRDLNAARNLEQEAQHITQLLVT